MRMRPTSRAAEADALDIPGGGVKAEGPALAGPSGSHADLWSGRQLPDSARTVSFCVAAVA